ncbi:hypothetical protein [Neptunitalea lumnitzerae]|uniref:Nucleoside phosphorylase domain-containing protein n=1 Tax=Neptunitalea lumnitzerae TaxID=2965509 RepID=A0ABQ5MM23_9FLAO|nr:hypothetical protein [Neptunitalea sp. Y10]GLB50419.1 hypothetical protein Y10_27870 [Neptunitalea sp. Y10]
MKVTILTPMEIEKEKTLTALARFTDLKHEYHVMVCGIGRESIAKTMMTLPESDVTVLLGFAAVIGKSAILPESLQLGKPVEVTAGSLYGYEGQLFENGSIKVEPSKTKLPCLFSLTSDKFVKTTDLTIGTLVNMEDYTFMHLKKKDDFIVRIISDFLPHDKPIDFFKEVEAIDFKEAIEAIENR